MILGLALMGLDAYGAFESTFQPEAGRTSYLVLAALCVAIAACTLPTMAERARYDGHTWKAALLCVAFLFAGAVVVMAALERTAKAQGRAVEFRQSANQRVTLAKDDVTQAERALAETRAETRVECRSGRGSRCRGLEQREEKARQRVANAKRALASTGVVVTEDPRARTLVALLPFLREETIALYAPAVLPLAMLITGFACIWYGTPHRRPKPKRNMARKRPGRTTRKGRSTIITVHGENISAFKALNDNR